MPVSKRLKFSPSTAATVALLAAALALGACGRKGTLDPPPAPASSLVTDQGGAPAGSMADNPGIGPDGKPLAPRGPNKRIPLDVLLN